MVLNWASHHAAILSTGDALMKTFHSDLQFSGYELVWLNTLGRAQQHFGGRGRRIPTKRLPSQFGPGDLSPVEGATGRQNCRKGGIGWSLQNVKHGVGGGFV
jgi:hypothetical protein